jgi:hypothetical protein
MCQAIFLVIYVQLPHLILKDIYQLNTVIILILYMKKLRHRVT